MTPRQSKSATKGLMVIDSIHAGCVLKYNHLRLQTCYVPSQLLVTMKQLIM